MFLVRSPPKAAARVVLSLKEKGVVRVFESQKDKGRVVVDGPTGVIALTTETT